MAQAIGNRRGELISLTILSAIHRLRGRSEQAGELAQPPTKPAPTTGSPLPTTP